MASVTSHSTGGGRTATFGSRRAAVATAATAAVLVAALGWGVAGAVDGPTGSVATHHGPAADHTVLGSYAHPGVTVSGDPIRVVTAGWSATVDVTGPQTPGEGFQYQPKSIVGTWTVSVYDVHGTIPLAAADFDSIDYLGRTFDMASPVGLAVPASVSTGQHVSFSLRADVPIGESLFRWAPDGDHIIGKWDNQVEND